MNVFRNVLTWPAVLLEIVFTRPIACFSIQFCFHDLPGKHDGAFIGVDVLGRISGLVEMLDEVDRKVLEVGEVKPVKPDHGTRAVLAVVVPVPGGSQDHVASLHGDSFSMDGREAALTFNDEAHGEGDVPVSASGLVGHDKLEPGVEGICREGGIFLGVSLFLVKAVGQQGLETLTSGRVDQHKHSPFRLRLGHDLTSSKETGPHFLVPPNKGHASRIGFRWIQLGHLRPQWPGVDLEGALH
jgi:hypothetical protein